MIKLHHFGKYDRSGKIRWLAHETGLTVDECPVKPGEHRQAPFTDLNPYAAIPVVQWGDQTLIESEAALTYLAEQYPEKKLIVQPGEAARYDFLKWMAVSGNTLETKLVEYSLGKSGLFPSTFIEMNEETLKFKLKVAISQLPAEGYLVADRFTIADISFAFVLRLAVNAELVELDSVKHYLSMLNKQHPAAREADFFGQLVERL
ncbi:MAG: glutathione S-transferase family protein [Reinekea sp.]